MSDVYVPVGDDATPTDGLGVPDEEAGVDHGETPEDRPPASREPPPPGGSPLGRYLSRKGFRVEDHPTAGRTTTWDRVRWVFVHHTGSPCDPDDERQEAHYIKTAEGRFPPLAQLMLGQSGKVWVLCEQRAGQNEPGRASHAGFGIFPGIPRDCANQVALGIEVQCSGAHPLRHHREQYDVLVDLVAALCRRYGLSAKRVVGHKEWSSIGKVDPRDDLDDIRRDVARKLRGGSVGSSPAATPTPAAAGTPASPAASATPFVPRYRQGRKVYRSKMRAGQVDSDSVWNLQSALLVKGFAIPDGPTDEYTPEAVAACRRFQLAQGWTGDDADGIGGPVTVDRLGLVWVAD